MHTAPFAPNTNDTTPPVPHPARPNRRPGAPGVGALMVGLGFIVAAFFLWQEPDTEPPSSSITAAEVSPYRIEHPFEPTAVFTDAASAVWPVPDASRAEISSTFGPRIRQSTDAYDWHRGIDIHGSIGDDVVAVSDGQFVGIRNWDDGGLSVILRHEIAGTPEFAGQRADHWYSVYMHLSEVAPELVAAEANGDSGDRSDAYPIVAGQSIGALGASGSVVTPHLHFEARIGSRCSLEFQLANPQSSCSTTGYDPHIHPLALFPSTALDIDLALSPPAAVDQPLRFHVTTPDRTATISSYTIETRRDGQVIGEETLDLNRRVGFDATSNAALDTPDTTTIHLDPQPFVVSDDRWTMDVIVPASLIDAVEGASYRLIVTDLWGQANSMEFNPSDWRR